ncbi:MAG: PH domain-containing protein, partial [Acidobacteriota bacterium]
VGLEVIDLANLSGLTAILIWNLRLAVISYIPALVESVVPDILAYIAIHLRYDTMWYVMTDRSLRCRRGIWVILEHTITFENVQNVAIRRGPLQYFFLISTIVIETAGASEGEGQNQFAVGNKAIMEGIEDPEEICELIMQRVRPSKSAGLGDERFQTRSSEGWDARHINTLREILEEIKALTADSA